MVRLNDEQAVALERFEQWAQRRHTLDEQYRHRLEQVAEQVHREVYGVHEAEAYEVVGRVAGMGIPISRLAKAYGTTNRARIYELLDRYQPTMTEPEMAEAPSEAVPVVPVANQARVDVVDGVPYLTVTQWASEVNPGLVLNHERVELRPNGRVANRTDELIALNQELVQNTTLRDTVTQKL